jgi:hypothetical protein
LLLAWVPAVPSELQQAVSLLPEPVTRLAAVFAASVSAWVSWLLLSRAYFSRLWPLFGVTQPSLLARVSAPLVWPATA